MNNLDILIKNCDFHSIIQRCDNLEDANKIAQEIFKVGVIDEDITAYVCTCYLAECSADRAIKAVFHNAASMILTSGLAFLSGAYPLAYNHLLEATKCNPACVEYKQAILLTFSEIPDFKLDSEIQKNIAMDIIRIDPTNEIAQKFIYD